MNLAAYCVSDRYPAGMPQCDSLSVLSAETPDGGAAFGVLACGRGKRRDAERAGATAVRDFTRLFRDEILAGGKRIADESIFLSHLADAERLLQAKVRRYCRTHQVSVSIDITVVAVINALCCGLCQSDVGLYLIDKHRVSDLRQSDTVGSSPFMGIEKSPEMFIHQFAAGSSVLICAPALGSVSVYQDIPSWLHDPLRVRMRMKGLTGAAAREKGAVGASAILICSGEEGELRVDSGNDH